MYWLNPRELDDLHSEAMAVYFARKAKINGSFSFLEGLPFRNKSAELRGNLIIDYYNSGRINDCQLWQVCAIENGRYGALPAGEARRVYHVLGISPFSGYPLQPA